MQKKYAPKIAIGSFGQMGFMDALLATKALLTIKGEYTKESVNEAFRRIKDVKTDILCNPWTFGDGVRLANNADRTIVPQEQVLSRRRSASTSRRFRATTSRSSGAASSSVEKGRRS